MRHRLRIPAALDAAAIRDGWEPIIPRASNASLTWSSTWLPVTTRTPRVFHVRTPFNGGDPRPAGPRRPALRPGSRAAEPARPRRTGATVLGYACVFNHPVTHNDLQQVAPGTIRLYETCQARLDHLDGRALATLGDGLRLMEDEFGLLVEVALTDALDCTLLLAGLRANSVRGMSIGYRHGTGEHAGCIVLREVSFVRTGQPANAATAAILKSDAGPLTDADWRTASDPENWFGWNEYRRRLALVRLKFYACGIKPPPMRALW